MPVTLTHEDPILASMVEDGMVDVMGADGVVRRMEAPIGFQWECLRCAARWHSRKPGRPVACARCKSRAWAVAPHRVVTPAMEGMR